MNTSDLVHILVFGIFISFLGYDLLFYKWYQRGSGENDGHTSTLLQISFSINIGYTIFCYFKGYENNLYIMVLGLFFCLIGLFIRVWSIKTLNKFFSWKIDIQKGHQLVQKGPYKRLRHPSYSGGILAMVGFNMALGAWPALCFLVLTYIPMVLFRIRAEETVLGKFFKKDYEIYKKKSYSLIPFIL
ncbi:isoprenylcysteine carboxylmethyltransferase family protein [Bacteriovoracales bacterium]|nr:isoprenylcysteine carboxylmethyltransferase family protein [Bacteriovoracales bacterium]